ncbi:NAD-dependent epimerase/dehydratase family protein [Allomesorhizobium camelthorni]|uniref:NAD-dependent epimerase/dehydratase family protein n=1 Tax=Allomesorhizobium camelthorni TaxID=475069 RepID=A0A6G4WNA7_9HYPH|nr:NAD-dependent epimerase/dehydratase family protein [Mesorhizobium camelthorni]NGO55858.1 NAD-dependent epimerase/dehydratase family protein [Mesorhizobium camelthorni]
MKVLVTGGAGFVGSFLCEELHNSGHDIRIFDNFEPQVHSGAQGNLRNLLPNGIPLNGVELVFGDVRSPIQLGAALRDVDAVIHLAAQVGVGQSMYEVHRYVDHNTIGTAVLLELLASRKHNVRKLVVASSMSIYGEGGAHCASCGSVTPALRGATQMSVGDWEVRCPICGRTTTPVPTAESKPVLPTSIYAITKRDQEEMCLVVGRAYGIPSVALRFFNIYGPRQSLGNPYTGVAAIFSSRILNDRPPVVFEDGNQTRDFVHVKDVVQAISLALVKDEANGHVFNVGTGRPTSIKDVAILLSRKLRRNIAPQIEYKFREGDVRHCYADISKIKEHLGYAPTVELETGIDDLIDWAESQKADDRFEAAAAELAKRGLAR